MAIPPNLQSGEAMHFGELTVAPGIGPVDGWRGNPLSLANDWFRRKHMTSLRTVQFRVKFAGSFEKDGLNS